VEGPHGREEDGAPRAPQEVAGSIQMLRCGWMATAERGSEVLGGADQDERWAAPGAAYCRGYASGGRLKLAPPRCARRARQFDPLAAPPLSDCRELLITRFLVELTRIELATS
jgi:hypothetical protein